MEHHISDQLLQGFRSALLAEEHGAGTVDKYLRDVAAFRAFLPQGAPVDREGAIRWKAQLQRRRYAVPTINSMLAAVNSFFTYAGWGECRVKALRVQRRIFRDASRELSLAEYRKLLETAAARGQERLALLMETIGATGIRVSEVPYITVEAARAGRAEIALKGKIRVILLPGKLCRRLLRYAGHKKIASGEIFLTKDGNRLSRKQIWVQMKRLCSHAGVAPTKVFPHNLRHLFAQLYYKANRDIVKLADVLGHSSIETTRIYLRTDGREHIRQIERLGLLW